MQPIPSTIRVLERHSSLLRFSRKELRFLQLARRMIIIYEEKMTTPKPMKIKLYTIWFSGKLHTFIRCHGTLPKLKEIHHIAKNQVNGPKGPTNKMNVHILGSLSKSRLLIRLYSKMTNNKWKLLTHSWKQIDMLSWTISPLPRQHTDILWISVEYSKKRTGYPESYSMDVQRISRCRF